jgi:hypothetical protein
MTRHNLESLQALGFDRSSHFFGRPSLFAVACSCCQAAVINGVPCHELGCANATHECRGCNAQVPVRQRYCADCR